MLLHLTRFVYCTHLSYLYSSLHNLLIIAFFFFFFLMIRRPPRSTLSSSSAASDVYKRQVRGGRRSGNMKHGQRMELLELARGDGGPRVFEGLSVHAVDPETSAWLLSQGGLDGPLVAVLNPNPPVVGACQLSDAVFEPPAGPEDVAAAVVEAMPQEKESVRALLQEMGLPVADVAGSENLCVLDTLVLRPPYTARQCECANEIILGRVTQLLEDHNA
eukprot:TRINITY_DN28133_c0_g1_i4.p2 TRINITY_DN28133_c0_g1~~TRINITY_DN28133_c0_g1_i4.p2  ORF type:complete len:218 (+),score=42.98 TRINITY_DN28133_c0_g1_i4:37-690(+)